MSEIEEEMDKKNLSSHDKKEIRNFMSYLKNEYRGFEKYKYEGYSDGEIMLLMEKEITQLQKENDRICNQMAHFSELNTNLNKEIEEILKDAKEVCEGLEFYGDKKSYSWNQMVCPLTQITDLNHELDGEVLIDESDFRVKKLFAGKRARQCAPAIKRLYERIDLK